MDFLKSLWYTLVGVEEEPPKAIVHKRKASPKPPVTIRRRTPMPALTLEPPVSLKNTISYSMRNKDNKQHKSAHLTGLAQLETNRMRRTLKQGHKGKTTTNN